MHNSELDDLTRDDCIRIIKQEYPNVYSDLGIRIIIDYLFSLEDDLRTYIELKPIEILTHFTEYSSYEEFRTDHKEPIDNFEYFVKLKETIIIKT